MQSTSTPMDFETMPTPTHLVFQVVDLALTDSTPEVSVSVSLGLEILPLL